MGSPAIVAFDLDGTLCDTSTAREVALVATSSFLAVRASIPSEAVALHLNRYLSHAYSFLASGQLDTPSYRRGRFLTLSQVYPREREALWVSAAEVYDNAFYRNLHPFPGVRPALARLAQSHRVVVLTNGSREIQERKLLEARLREHIAQVVVSAELHIAKPEPEFFVRALRALGDPGGPLTYVSDDLVGDVLPARRLGIPSYHFSPSSPCQTCTDSCAPDFARILNLFLPSPSPQYASSL